MRKLTLSIILSVVIASPAMANSQFTLCESSAFRFNVMLQVEEMIWGKIEHQQKEGTIVGIAGLLALLNKVRKEGNIQQELAMSLCGVK